MVNLKKRAALSAMVLIVLCAVTVTCLLAQRQDTVSAMPALSEAMAVESEDPMTQFRTEREQLRQRQKAQLNDIIYNASSDEETIRLAQRYLLELMERESAELTLEGVLRTRGFEDALATVSGESVNIIVRREALTQREMAIILELVLRETGITSGNAKIIPIN